MTERSHPSSSATRRSFLNIPEPSMAGAAELAVARGAHAAGSDVIRIGLIGCGGRGTGAVVQALKADQNVKLVALADAFADQFSEPHATQTG